jgi:hypothetical protein
MTAAVAAQRAAVESLRFLALAGTLQDGRERHLVGRDLRVAATVVAEAQRHGLARQRLGAIVATAGMLEPAQVVIQRRLRRVVSPERPDFGLDMLPDQPARFLGSAPDLGAVESH